MQQHNEVPSTSIGSAAESNLPQATTSISHPPEPTPQQLESTPGISSNSSSSRSGPTSKKVQIPRLSPATTELLARVAGSIQGERQDGSSPMSKTSSNSESSYIFSGSLTTGEPDKMKISSAFIELPTPPFASSIPPVSDITKQPATASQENNTKPAGFFRFSAKPVKISSNSRPLVQPEVQSTHNTEPGSSSTTTDKGQGDDHQRSAEYRSIVSESAETPHTPQHVQLQLQSTAPVAQVASGTTSTTEQQNGGTTVVQLNDTYSRPAELVHIAPKPVDSPFASTPISAPGVPSQLQFTTPVVPGPSSFHSTDKRQKQVASSRQRKPATNGKRGRKRKRGNDSDDDEVARGGGSSSDESDITPTATQTKSGRQVNRPTLYAPPLLSPGTSKGNNSPNGSNMVAPAAQSRKRRRVYRKGKETNINCSHCQRGHSPATNAIVFCDNCNKAWHQLCHDPPIDNEVVTIQEKEWICRECKPVPSQAIYPTIVRSNPALQARPLGPPIHPPLPMPQIEVGAEGYSKDERRGYLSNLSHSTLVELLVTLSDRNPSVPMFPANLKSFPASKFSYQSAQATSADTPSSSNTTVQPANTTSEQASQSALGPTPNSMTSSHHRDELSDESEYEEVEDHRLYPRAGNGFRLPHDDNELDILQEDPACPTFSYALHGPAKARAEANEAAPVWGAA